MKVKVCKCLARELASKQKWEDWKHAQIQKDAQKIFNKNAKF